MSTAPAPPSFTDDKSPTCISFILNLLQTHNTSSRPLIIGLNGLQGVGKTTLVTTLSETLSSGPSNIPTLVLSIDDFYLTHADQRALATSHPSNALLQHRGEPGTHDVDLARSVFESLLEGRETRIPSYDKAAFEGRGDRRPVSEWPVVNAPGEEKIRLVILEGWCVGFRSITPDVLKQKWEGQSLTLKNHALEDLAYVNDQLRGYDALTDLLDGFIHVDAEDLSYVYAWRREQEVALRAERGTGMTDEEVVKFVDAYYPAYELYCDGVRAGVLPDKPKHQLRLIVGRDRKVKEVQII